jgi:hypothetical protein
VEGGCDVQGSPITFPSPRAFSLASSRGLYPEGCHVHVENELTKSPTHIACRSSFMTVVGQHVASHARVRAYVPSLQKRLALVKQDSFASSLKHIAPVCHMNQRPIYRPEYSI